MAKAKEYKGIPIETQFSLQISMLRANLLEAKNHAHEMNFGLANEAMDKMEYISWQLENLFREATK